MDKEFKFNIDNHIINVFSSKELPTLLKEYHLDNYNELNQIHSNIVNIVKEDYCKIDGDALITNLVNTPLVIKTADCIPIVLYDKKRQVIAAIHSGWRGTMNSIVIDALNTMINKFNSNKEDIAAYLYPSIRKCHFEVEIDTYNEFKNKIKNIDKYTTKKEPKYYINLQQIVKDNLIDNGINKIEDSNICTYCHHQEFYSYRYDHTYKRNYLIVSIKE